MGCANFLQTPEQLLFTAAATNDLALAKHALHLHKVANIADKAHDTPVHVAIRHEAIDVLKFLLKHPVDLTVCNKKGNSPLHEAAIKGSLAAAKLLLHARRPGTKGAADPNQMQGLRLEATKKPPVRRFLLQLIDYTPAWRSGPPSLPLKTARSRRRRALRLDGWFASPPRLPALCACAFALICVPVHPLNKIQRGWTALHIAAYHNDARVAEELVKCHANVNQPNEFGRTPLHIAAYRGHLELATLLLMHEADPNLQDSKGDTPLHDAVGQDAFEVTELLLYFGASNQIINNASKVPSACATNMTMVNVTTRPLHVAVAAGQITLVGGLLEHGALVDGAGIMGESPLHLAAAHGDVETAKMLLEHEADVNAVDDDYNTPLHYAAGMGQIEMVQFLLEHGALRDLRNMDEKTAKQLVPVARNRQHEGSSHGHHHRRIVVEDDVTLKIARRMSTQPGVISPQQWHESHAQLPTRESTRFSIRGQSMSRRVKAPPEPEHSSTTIDPTIAAHPSPLPLTHQDKSARHHRKRKSLQKNSKQALEAAETVAREHAQRELELAELTRAAALSDALKRHMLRLRPWGRVIPPPDVQEEAISAALDEVDGPGAGLAHRKAAYEDFLMHRRERLGRGIYHQHSAKGGEGKASTQIAPMDLG